MAKSYKAPQKAKTYQPKVETEKHLKIRGIVATKKLKHKKAYYNNESDSA